MKKSLLLFIALAVRYSLLAQSLSPFVISSSGNYSQGGNISLSSTTGESTLISTFSSGSSILTQGFQQPNDASVGVSSPENPISIIWYPNPAGGLLSLECDMTIGLQKTHHIRDLVIPQRDLDTR